MMRLPIKIIVTNAVASVCHRCRRRRHRRIIHSPKFDFTFISIKFIVPERLRSVMGREKG